MNPPFLTLVCASVTRLTRRVQSGWLRPGEHGRPSAERPAPHEASPVGILHSFGAPACVPLQSSTPTTKKLKEGDGPLAFPSGLQRPTAVPPAVFADGDETASASRRQADANDAARQHRRTTAQPTLPSTADHGHMAQRNRSHSCSFPCRRRRRAPTAIARRCRRWGRVAREVRGHAVQLFVHPAGPDGQTVGRGL